MKHGQEKCGYFHYLCKCGRICDCQICQNLAVEVYVGGTEQVYELAVVQPYRARGLLRSGGLSTRSGNRLFCRGGERKHTGPRGLLHLWQGANCFCGELHNIMMGKAFPSLQPPVNITANRWAFSATPSCPDTMAKYLYSNYVQKNSAAI